METALASVRQPTLVIGVDSDALYPVHEQRELADGIPRATYAEISSEQGHDGFLLEQEQVTHHVGRFLAQHCPNVLPTAAAFQ